MLRLIRPYYLVTPPLHSEVPTTTKPLLLLNNPNQTLNTQGKCLTTTTTTTIPSWDLAFIAMPPLLLDPLAVDRVHIRVVWGVANHVLPYPTLSWQHRRQGQPLRLLHGCKSHVMIAVRLFVMVRFILYTIFHFMGLFICIIISDLAPLIQMHHHLTQHYIQ